MSLQGTSQQKRQIDISGLQDFKITAKEDWTNWQFRNEQYDHVPLGFNNKFNFYRNLKYCDLQQAPQDSQFVEVFDIVKKKNKDFISKYDKMSENIQGNRYFIPYRRNQKKKVYAPPQTKTNFKKITVKNNWEQLESIKKNNIDEAKVVNNFKVETLKTIGNLNEINPQLDRISWEEVRFKQNTVYEVNTIKTANDQYLSEIAANLMNQETDNGRVNVICHPNFLLALLTARASSYPWNIQIQKMGNIIVLQNFKQNKEADEKQLTYLDLFTSNENTSNNMPTEQSKIKQNCINATRMTQVFKDLLASGDRIQQEELEDLFENNPISQEQQKQEEGQQNEGQEQQEEEEEEAQKQPELQKIRKYIKISLDKIDIYTYVQIDGAKRNSKGQLQYSLIRIFMESETQGKWQRDMKSPGSLITKQLTSNSCSIHKWICEARLAGVETIRIGYIGIGQTVDQKKIPLLLNVSNNSVKSLQTTLSFKYESCWGSAKYMLNLLVGLENGNYVLAKNPYAPLSIKLYRTSTAEEDEDLDEEEEKQEQEVVAQEQK